MLKGELEARAGLVFSATKVGVVKVMLTTTISTDACEELSNYGYPSVQLGCPVNYKPL